MNNRFFQTCTRCIMDTSDPDISFDTEGVCNHCQTFDSLHVPNWYKGKEGEEKISNLLSKIKKDSEGKKYDCIIGLSGGVDSAYLAYLCGTWGLNPLVVHVDAGWNSELAVKNIENICKKLNFDLYTDVIDWSIMKELQRAFLKSRVVNQDIPQDHAFFSALYKYAVKNRIKYVLTGYNISSEGVLPIAWRGFPALDKTHLKDIFYKNGGKDLGKFPLIGTWQYRILNPYLYRMKMIAPLNYMDYDKRIALQILKEKLDFNDYGDKHSESRFTKFHQNYFLPTMYGYEKRKAHISSLVLAGQLSRSEALEEIKIPLYKSELEKSIDVDFVVKKLGFSMEEFNEIMAKGPGRHEDYSSEHTLNTRIDKFTIFLRKYINW